MIIVIGVRTDRRLHGKRGGRTLGVGKVLWGDRATSDRLLLFCVWVFLLFVGCRTNPKSALTILVDWWRDGSTAGTSPSIWIFCVRCTVRDLGIPGLVWAVRSTCRCTAPTARYASRYWCFPLFQNVVCFLGPFLTCMYLFFAFSFVFRNRYWERSFKRIEFHPYAMCHILLSFGFLVCFVFLNNRYF